ncbi:MAG: extracellular solute-binding protein [Acidobacteriota bacterium]
MKRLSRRALLKAAGAAGVAAAASSWPLAGCAAPSGKPADSGSRPRLTILQWSHFVPRYDRWFDGEFTKAWGERHGVDVVVDHMSAAEINARGAGEAVAGQGHDLFLFISPPAAYEDQVLDLADVVAAVEKKHGPAVSLAQRSNRNPRTGKWFAFSDSYVPDPGNYRIDLWADAGFPKGPDSWEDLRVGGRVIKSRTGSPVGIGLSQEVDSNMTLRALLWSFGGAEQDERGRVVLDSPATVEALKFMRALYLEAMTPEVFTWDPSSNNRLMLSGRGSFIQNAISVTRAAEKDDPQMARRIGISRPLAGPVRRMASAHLMNCWVIWKSARNPQAAKAFLADLIDASASVFRESELYNMPCFPTTVPDAAKVLAEDPNGEPRGKYAVLAGALDWTGNIGYPGFASAAADQVFNAFLIPLMFARTARGDVSPQEAARDADREAKRIFERRA